MSVLLGGGGGNVPFFLGYTPQKVGHPGSRKSLHHELRRRGSNPLGFWNHMYYSLSSLKGSIEEIIWGSTIGLLSGILGVWTVAHISWQVMKCSH